MVQGNTDALGVVFAKISALLKKVRGKCLKKEEVRRWARTVTLWLISSMAFPVPWILFPVLKVAGLGHSAEPSKSNFLKLHLK